MTHFDSLPAANSQAANAYVKQPAAPRDDTDPVFAQFWSAEYVAEHAEPMTPGTMDVGDLVDEPASDGDIEQDDTPTPADMGLHTETARLDDVQIPRSTTENEPVQGIDLKARTDASPAERKFAADLQGISKKEPTHPSLEGTETPDQTPPPIGNAPSATNDSPDIAATAAPLLARQSDLLLSRGAKPERVERHGDKVKKTFQIPPEMSASTPKTAPTVPAPTPPPTSTLGIVPNVEVKDMPTPLVTDTPSDTAFVPSGGLTLTPQTQTAQQMAQTVVVNRTHAAQVAQQITAAIVQTSGGTTEIMLNPEELGRVRIAMTAGDAGLTVTLFAERPETTELMRRNIEHLTRELRDLGYENPTFSFENQSGGSDNTWGDPEQPIDGLFDPPDVAPAQITRHYVALSGGLDLKL